MELMCGKTNLLSHHITKWEQVNSEGSYCLAVTLLFGIFMSCSLLMNVECEACTFGAKPKLASRASSHPTSHVLGSAAVLSCHSSSFLLFIFSSSELLSSALPPSMHLLSDAKLLIVFCMPSQRVLPGD